MYVDPRGGHNQRNINRLYQYVYKDTPITCVYIPYIADLYILISTLLAKDTAQHIFVYVCHVTRNTSRTIRAVSLILILACAASVSAL